MIGSDEGGRKGGDEGRVTREEASQDMTRGYAPDGRVSGLVFIYTV